jgi:hypothetical protein
MRHLRIVGDGERDAVTLPPLVKRIMDCEFTHESTPWPRLHRGQKKIPSYSLKGYGLRLAYLYRSARSRGADGLVACIDADKNRRRQRLRQIKQAREADRSLFAPLPTALGEAKPHSEAWLLDDPVAVREGLGLSKDHVVPNALNTTSPKTMLEELHAASERRNQRPLDVWPAIAANLDVSRCAHSKQTGFAPFVEELRAELGPLFAKAT